MIIVSSVKNPQTCEMIEWAIVLCLIEEGGGVEREFVDRKRCRELCVDLIEFAQRKFQFERVWVDWAFVSLSGPERWIAVT